MSMPPKPDLKARLEAVEARLAAMDREAVLAAEVERLKKENDAWREMVKNLAETLIIVGRAIQ